MCCSLASAPQPIAWAAFKSAGLIDTIRDLKQPLLGICVGMQLLFESSEEGEVECLGLLPGRVRRFERREDCRCRTWDGINSSSSNAHRSEPHREWRLCLLRAQLRRAALGPDARDDQLRR